MTTPKSFCPYLGLQFDAQSMHSSASEEHGCFANDKVVPIELSHQENFCLSGNHVNCPLFRQANPREAVAQHGVKLAPRFDPNAFEQTSDDPEHLPPPLTTRWDSLRITRWVVVLALLLFVGVYFLRPVFNDFAPQPTVVAVTRTPTLTTTPSPTATPRPTLSPTPTRINTGVVAPPSGGELFSFNPAAGSAGWVVSDERVGNHLSDHAIRSGVFNQKIYYGLLEFDLSRIPNGTRIVYATLDLVGVNGEQLAPGGSWQIKLLNLPQNVVFSNLNYDAARALPWDYIVANNIQSDQLGAGKVNRIEISGPALVQIEQLFGKGRVAFRIEGPSSGADNIFAWDTGADASGQGYRPVLHIGTGPLPATETQMVVVPCVPTPSSLAGRANLAVTATYEATVIGTPTPYPTNYATQVPVTPTPTPSSVFAAATTVAQMTLQATRVGTATPIPANWVVVLIVTPSPAPASQATAAYVSALATAQAATTGTPTPLPCHVAVATATPTAPAIAAAGTLQPTATPSPTPTGIPPELSGKIAFFSDRDGQANLWVMEPDGTVAGRLNALWAYEAARLKQATTSDGQYQLGVEGNQLVRTRIMLSTRGVGSKVVFDQDAVSYDPIFSPDNQTIVFVSTITGHDELYRTSRDSAEIAPLTKTNWEWNKTPSFSPDGRRIVWMTNSTGRQQIWVMNADGSQLRNLSNNQYNDWGPVWFR